jgi:hypothetical protein
MRPRSPRPRPPSRRPALRPTPADLPTVDPLLAQLRERAQRLWGAGVAYRTIAAGASIPPSTLTDFMAGRRVHLTVADARALARYLRLDLALVDAAPPAAVS